MWKTWHKRQDHIREKLRASRVYRILGERVFAKYVWIHDCRAISGGLALGVFVALTPTIPFQMLLAAVGSLFFRVNLPIAVAACWITNPVTAVPIYVFSWRLGRHILENVFLIEDLFDVYPLEGSVGRIIQQAAYLWAGSLCVATLAATGAYLIVRSIWLGSERLHARAKRRRNDIF
jgi:uncharacterized protein (DUF2062 family)